MQRFGRVLVGAARGWVHALLLLYPRVFRRRFGADMAKDFDERLEERAARGLLPVVLVVAQTTADVAAAALREWLRPSVARDVASPDDKRTLLRGNIMDHLKLDLRFALRSLARRPGFTAIAVITLALGIGANTAIFSVVNGVLLRPLPYPEPDRLVQVWTRFTGIGLPRDENNLSPPEVRDIQELGRSFSHVATYANVDFNMSGAGQPERMDGALVSPALFPMLGINPVTGRVFTTDDAVPGRDNVVLISHGLWLRRFGANARVVGQTVQLNERPYIVSGVLPEDFEFPNRTAVDVIAPLTLGGTDYLPVSRGDHRLKMIARLAPGVSLEQARADMSTVSHRMIEANGDYPYERYDFGIVLTALLEQTVRDARPILLLLTGAVGLVLLVACINIANLLLVRGSTRGAEMAVRRALGASRARLVGQMIIEGLVLAACGGATGFLLGYWGTGAIVHLASDLPRAGAAAALDIHVLGFTAVLTLMTAILVSLAPALHASGAVDLQWLRQGTHRVKGDRSGHRLRHGLVIFQVALSLAVLVSAGLLMRSFVTLLGVDPGFNAKGVVTMGLSFLGQSHQTPERRHALFEDLLPRLRALPGVEAAGAVSTLPLDRSTSGTVTIETLGESPTPDADLLSITPGYLESLRIPLLRGRGFDATDAAESAPVVVVDETLAETFWPGEEPIGKRIKRGFHDYPSPWATVVGVVGHVRQQTLESPSRVQVYWPYAQSASSTVTLVVRTAGNPRALINAVREQVLAIDPEQPVHDVRSMEAVVSNSLAGRRAALLIIGVLSGLGLVLASIGLYGVLAYTVAQRMHEFGVRAALGAGPTAILRYVLARGMTVVVAGCAVGLATSLVLGRVLQGLLYGVSPVDPLTFAGVLALFLGAALLASYLPARRAARVDPTTALKDE